MLQNLKDSTKTHIIPVYLQHRQIIELVNKECPQRMDISHLIDHTTLKPNCTLQEVKQLCEEALTHGFAAVCIPPYYVRTVARLLEDTRMKVTTVVGFPYGYSTTPAKVEEVKRAIDEGCHEVDVVINLCAAFERNWSYLKNDINSVTTAAHLRGKVIKLILETSMFDEQQLKKLCDICNDIGVDFVCTSTGINAGGATLKAVRFLRKHLNQSIKIKASGGIKTADKAHALVQAGANRIGSTQSLKVIGL